MSEIEKTLLAIVITNELLNASKKILAIKIVRLMYSINLKDAKELVDRIEALKSEVKK